MASETKITETTATTGVSNTSTPPPAATPKRNVGKELTPFVVQFRTNAAAAIVCKRKLGISNEATTFRHRVGGANVVINLGQLYDEVTKGNYDLLELDVLDAAFLEQYIEVADGRFNEWIEVVNKQNGSPLNSEQLLAIQTAYHDPTVFRDNEANVLVRANRDLFREALAEVKASYGI